MAEWIESVLSGFESQLSEVRAHDLPPHLGRTEPAVILGASAIWQGGEGPGHEALLGRAAGQARGSGFERRHSTAIQKQSLRPRFEIRLKKNGNKKNNLESVLSGAVVDHEQARAVAVSATSWWEWRLSSRTTTL